MLIFYDTHIGFSEILYSKVIFMKRYFQASGLARLCFLTVLVLILTTLPLLYIARYDHSSADDYTYGNYTHQVWEETHSPVRLIGAAFQTSHDFWYTYQGPFASAFFMSLQPSVISERLYGLTAWLMLGMLIASHFLFFKVLLGDYLGAKPVHYITIAAAFLVLCIQTMPDPVEAYYWYVGSVHYTFMYSCMLFLLSCLMLFLKTSSRIRGALLLFLACLLGLICGGSNFITALQTPVLLCLFGGFCLFYRNRKALWCLLPLGFTLTGLYFNVTAPGNTVRQGEISPLSPVTAIYDSFRYAVTYFKEWTNIYFLLLLLFLTPVIWHFVSRSHRRYPLPGLVIFLSFCGYACMFTPSVYSLGFAGYARVLNIIMCALYLFLFLDLIYFLGWLASKTTVSVSNPAFRKPFLQSWYTGIAVTTLVALFFTKPDQITSFSAVNTLYKGYAQSYHQENLDRISMLSLEGVDEVWVPNFSVEPHLLFFDNLDTDETCWKNQAVAEWFGKKVVHMVEVYQLDHENVQ